MQLKDAKNPLPNEIKEAEEPDVIELIFYTDPLCCWSWAMQPQWKKFLGQLRGHNVSVTYKMAGLLPSWKHFNDSLNSIRTPAQMGPEWMHAGKVSGTVINGRIWITDPPASSFPACIAVKCAELQAVPIGGHFLNLLREAVMVKGKNIAKGDILLEIASTLEDEYPEFDFKQFRNDLFGERGKKAFEKDVKEWKYLNASRLPAILFKSQNKGSMLLCGYQSYESLVNVYCKLN